MEKHSTTSVAQKTIDVLKQMRLEPNPQNYTLWHRHFSQGNPNLSSALERIHQKNGIITQDDVTHLYREHYGLEHTYDQLRKLLDRLIKETEPKELALQHADMENLKKTIHSGVRELRLSTDMLYRKIIDVNHVTTNNRKGFCSDPLTGLGSRQQFDREMAEHLLKANRNNADLSLMLVSPNTATTSSTKNTKPFTTSIAACLYNNTKGKDIICHYMDDIFAIILPKTSNAGTIALAEVLCQELASLAIQINTQNPSSSEPLTFSIGATSYHFPEVSTDMTKRCEIYLKKARSYRGDRLVIDDVAHEGFTSVSPLRPQGAA